MSALILLITGLLVGSYLFFKQKLFRLQIFCYCCFLVGLFAILPFEQLSPVLTSPTQIVYRFDENRYIQLTGYRCEGQAYFIDKKEQVYTELAPHSWRLFLPPYAHPAKNYISIPMSDISAIDTSIDGGRTFSEGLFDIPAKSRGLTPNIKEIASYTVVNDQGFFLTKNDEIFMGHKPFGSRSGIFVNKAILEQDKHLGYSWSLYWQDIPDTVPPIPDDYSGWREMKCNPLAPGQELRSARTELLALQKPLRLLLGMVPSDE